jgi:hypothetical protein
MLNPTYLRALRAAHPRLIGSAHIGVGDGWYSLVRDTLDKVERECRSMPEVERPTVDAIEQKYGTLRVYLTTTTPQLERILFESEAASEATCETCGKPGLLRQDAMWWVTLCPACARNRAEKTHWRIENYPWLSMLAAGRTTATFLDGRACRALYESATLLNSGILDDHERELMDMLKDSYDALDLSFERLLRKPDKLRESLDDILTRPLDKFLEEIREIREIREKREREDNK